MAAVSTGAQVAQIITSAVSGLALGGTVLVGKYTDIGDDERAYRTIGTTLSIFTIVTLVLTIGILIFRSAIPTALRTPAVSMDGAGQYVTICFCGIFFICGYNAINAILQGYGDSRKPMYFVALSCVLNIAGDVIFVKYLKLGVTDTALATVLPQSISIICSIVYLNRKKFIFTFALKSPRIDRDRLRELTMVGVPISSQECMVRLSFLYLTSVADRLGVNAAATVGIASKCDVFVTLPATSIASALIAITTRNYGTGRLGRARQSLAAGIGFAVLASSVLFLWAQLSPHTVIGLFNTNSEIIEAGIPFFQSCSFDYLAVSFVFCLNGFMNSRSKIVSTMINYCFGTLVLRMPLIWLTHTYCPDNLLVIGLVAPTVSGLMAFYTLLFVIRQLKQDEIERQKELTSRRV